MAIFLYMIKRRLPHHRNEHPLHGRPMPLSIIEAHLRVSLKLLHAIVPWFSRGFRWAPMIFRGAGLSDVCTTDRCRFYMWSRPAVSKKNRRITCSCWFLRTVKWVSVSCQIEWNTIMSTIFHLFWNQIWFGLVSKQKENSRHKNQSPFLL